MTSDNDPARVSSDRCLHSWVCISLGKLDVKLVKLTNTCRNSWADVSVLNVTSSECWCWVTQHQLPENLENVKCQPSGKISRREMSKMPQFWVSWSWWRETRELISESSDFDRQPISFGQLIFTWKTNNREKITTQGSAGQWILTCIVSLNLDNNLRLSPGDWGALTMATQDSLSRLWFVFCLCLSVHVLTLDQGLLPRQLFKPR